MEPVDTPPRSPAAEVLRRLPGRSRLLLVAGLAVLHLAVLQRVGGEVGRTLLIGHLGLFLLWQPLVRAETRLSRLELAAIAAGCAAVFAWANPVLVMLWVMLLAGILGGKVFLAEGRAGRLFHLLALAYLLCILLLRLAPEALPWPVGPPAGLEPVTRYGLPLLLAAMLALPDDRDDGAPAEVIDFVYSALVFLLLAVLVLGSYALLAVTGRGYFESLALALTGVSAVLFILGWSWNPRMGSAGLGLLFSRHMLSAGMPFEQWLDRLTALARDEPEPQRFLEKACEQLLQLPGVRGGAWHADSAHGEFGVSHGSWQHFEHEALDLEISTSHPLGPALAWHFNLLVQMLGEFYLAKRRAAELEQVSYVRAVHETGARVTHDVKNLLQSLNTLCFAAEREGEEVSPQYQALLRRQLPAISRRLQLTLDKLHRPSLDVAPLSSGEQWWIDLQRRYAGQPLQFQPVAVPDETRVPAELFNRVAENLIQNALDKHAAGRAQEVSVGFDPQRCALTVSDDGPAVPEEVMERLFRSPVPSETGYGIGLFQASRQAALYGYALRVQTNDPGAVRFRLEPAPTD